MSRTTLTTASYVGIDFDTAFDDIRAELQTNFASSYNDFALSSLGIMLIDIISNSINTLSFYLDQRATDNFLSTARTRKAVARISRQLGYKMQSAVSCSVDVQVNLKKVPIVDITIPIGFKFSGPNGLEYEVAQAVTFPAGSPITLVKDIPCFEGSTASDSFVSDGTANQVFVLRGIPAGKYIAGGTAKVTVDGAIFTEEEFLTFDATNQFEIGYNDDPPTLRFGDGVTGNIPIKGAQIKINYFVTSGKLGQANRNTIQKETSPLVVNFQTVQLNINNALPATGGDDPESLESAKTNAGKKFKTRQVAITREDYETLSRSFADPLFGRVAAAQAISARSSDADLELKNQLVLISGEVNNLSTTVTPILLGPTTIVGTVSLALGATLSGLTLALALPNGKDITITFSGTDPILSTTIINQINSAVGYNIASIDVTNKLVLTDTAITIYSSSTALAALGLSSVVAANAKLRSIDTNLSKIGAVFKDIASEVTTVDTLAQTALASSRSIKNTAADIQNDVLNAQASITDGKAQIASTVAALTAITPGVSDVLTAATLTSLKALLSAADADFDSVNSEVSSTNTSAGTIDTAASSLITGLATVRDDLTSIGLTVSATVPPPDLISKADSIRGLISTTLGTNSPKTGLYKDISSVQDAVDSLNVTVVTEALAAIDTHVDKILSDDCRANLVIVPILARDADGFYVAPSNALVNALQVYLDARKEVTQTVEVTSGVNSLIYPVIKVRAQIKDAVLSVATTAIGVAVDNVLRNRVFGDTLYVSELIKAVLDVSGVISTNIEILGNATNINVINNTFTTDTSLLDGDCGNLVITDSQVVTKAPIPGTITITVS